MAGLTESITRTNSQDAKTMESFHCDALELRLFFEAGQLNCDALLSAIKNQGIETERGENGDFETLLLFGGESDALSSYHAHMTIRVWSDQSGRVDITYFPGDIEKVFGPPPTVADCVQWIGEFFTAKISNHIHINYTFDKSFAPTMSLNFPLTTTEKSLAGVMVSGLALIFPHEPATTAIIQSGGSGETYLFIRKTADVEPKGFNLFAELEQVSVFVNSLIKKTTLDESR